MYSLQSLWRKWFWGADSEQQKVFPSLKPGIFERPRSVTGSETTQG